jgi:hypothetical protein
MELPDALVAPPSFVYCPELCNMDLNHVIIHIITWTNVSVKRLNL